MQNPQQFNRAQVGQAGQVQENMPYSFQPSVNPAQSANQSRSLQPSAGAYQQPDIQFTAQSYTYSQQQPNGLTHPHLRHQQSAQQGHQKTSTVYSQPIIPPMNVQQQVLDNHHQLLLQQQQEQQMQQMQQGYAQPQQTQQMQQQMDPNFQQQIPQMPQVPQAAQQSQYGQQPNQYDNGGGAQLVPANPQNALAQVPQTSQFIPQVQVLQEPQSVQPQQPQQIQLPPQVVRKLEKPDHLDDGKGKAKKRINRSVFKSSFWDQAPFKRNNQERNQIIQIDYFFNADVGEIELPEGYEWAEFDPENDYDIEIMTEFLNKHYQKYDKEYKPMYLKWLLTPPTYSQYKRLENVPRSTWFVGVRSKNGILVGLITARPIIYQIDEKYIQTFTVDFLCTHKQLRGKGLAPVLVKEMYRRLATFQYDIGASFVANTHLPFNTTVKTSQIVFRPLTMEKISKTLFSSVPPEQLEKLKLKYENIQPTNDLQLIRFANTEDVPMMMNIYEDYCQKYRLSHTMNREEFEHYFVPNNEMIFTYVITNAQGEIKDFISLHAFWTRRGEKNAYLYYVSFINEMLLELLMRNVLFIMKSQGFDMIFANDVMGISNVFTRKLDFKSLDEICNYYFFNYNTQTIEKHECGMNRVF